MEQWPIMIAAVPDLVVATRLQQIWQGNGMLLLDLEPPYREALARGANLFLPYNLHPGPEGMRVAADAIYRTLISERMLPPVPRAACGERLRSSCGGDRHAVPVVAVQKRGLSRTSPDDGYLHSR